MNSIARRFLWAVPIVSALFLTISDFNVMERPAPSLQEPSAHALSLSLDDIDPDSVKMRIAEEVFSSIKVPPAISGEFLDLYNRHRLEIDRMVSDNPFIMWESLDLALESLPALRAMNQNGGMLYLDKKTYSRAMGLVGQCEALASPRLGSDLEKAKSLLMSRTNETGSGEIVINLSR